jgi:hypothetical protein
MATRTGAIPLYAAVTRSSLSTLISSNKNVNPRRTNTRSRSSREKMAPIIRHLLVLSLLVAVIASGDDLLDEYVRHVDDVNRISDKPNKSDQRSIPKRNRRDLPNQWTHSEILDNVGDVVLRWQPRHREILFRVEARTKGYVAIGFSPDGGKEHADIVMGWVDDRSLRAVLLVSSARSKLSRRILTFKVLLFFLKLPRKSFQFV